MQDHTILCRNCNTRVARTPNQVCVKCKTPRWGYTIEELNGTTPVQPRTPQQPAQNQPWNTNPPGNQPPTVTKLICKNCKTLVAITPDNKCVNCGRVKWGYTDRQLNNMNKTVGGISSGLSPLTKKLLIAVGALIVLVALGFLLAPRFWKPNLFEKYSKSVVMLYSEYVYTLSINGKTMYFDYNEEKNAISAITTNPDSAGRMGLYGTGFFIDNEGRIVTNRHVVHHFSVSDETNCRNLLTNEMEKDISDYSNIKDSASVHISNFSILATHYFDIGDTLDAAAYIKKRNDWMAYQSEVEKKIGIYESFRSGMQNAQFDVAIIFLGYATDGTTVNVKSDYKASHVIKYSNDQAVDLAVIQSNDHKLPEGVTNYIAVDGIGNGGLKVGDDVTLIGYNHGAEIGVTQTGLHVQKIDGKISQEPDGTKVLYSINSLAGSSGSPVFSSNGTLVAVNFAGVRQSPGYNYGILATHIPKLLKDE